MPKTDHPAVKHIREAVLSYYPGATFGDALEGFMSDVEWEPLKGEDGRAYVNVKGRAYLYDKPVSVLLQYRSDGDITNVGDYHAFEVNGLPQPKELFDQLLPKVYRELRRGRPAQVPNGSQKNMKPATSDEPPTDIRKIWEEFKASPKTAHAKYSGKRLKLIGTITFIGWIAGPRFLVDEDIHCFWRESRVKAEADGTIIVFLGEDKEIITAKVEGERIVFEGKIEIDKDYDESAKLDDEEDEEIDGMVRGPLNIYDCTISNPWTSGRRLGNTKTLPESRRQ
jgi:hypothetical protein